MLLKILRSFILLWLGFVLFFGWGFATFQYKIFPWEIVAPILTEIELAIKGDDEGSILDAKTALTAGFTSKPLKHMKKKDQAVETLLSKTLEMGRFPEFMTNNCIKIATSHNHNLAILLIGNNAKVLHEWNVNYDSVFGTSGENNQTDINGSLLLEDGSVIVNYAPYKGIAKFDIEGNVVWKNDILQTHHSVTKTQSNSIWVPGRETLTSTKLGQPEGRLEDVLFEFDITTGELKRKIYTVDIFFKNSLHGLYEWIISEDKVHVNDIEEVGEKFAEANKSLKIKPTDIIMTGKRMNVVLIVDPDTLDVKYVRSHPWNQPHDTDPLPDGSFLLFDNNQSKGRPRMRWGPSRILKVWPTTNETEVAFSENWFFSSTRSDQEIAGNQILITADNPAYLINVADGKPNYWYTKPASKKKNWFIEDARWVGPEYFTNTVIRDKCIATQ